jgi:Zn finger protein HypA/HybF involved in hydrogenase expression
MDKVQMGRDLIKKGQELGDDSLIVMGYDLINENAPESTEESSQFLESLIPTYECTNCGHTLSSEKPRKRCPECRKHKLVLQEEKADESHAMLEALQTQLKKKQQERETGIFHFKTNKQQNRQRINPDTGEEEGTYTRAEAIDTNKIHDTNLFENNPKAFQEDTKKFTQKVDFQVSQRRPQPKQRQFTCENCKKTITTSAMHSKQYMCDRCISRRAVR